MKPLDINELVKSDYVLVALLVVEDRVIGYSILDKIIVSSLRNKDLLRQNTETLRDASFARMNIYVHCDENDSTCIEQARRLGIEPNREYTFYMTLAAISTRLLDLDKLKSLIESYLGEASSEIVSVYGSKEEVLLNATELVNYYRSVSLLLERHQEESEETTMLGEVSGKVVIVDEDGSIKLENIM